MRLGLVLSGGGANGAFEAGVLAAIEEAGLAPTILSGTSAGALNVAGMAHGMDAAALADAWRGIGDRDVFRLRRDVTRAVRPSGWFSSGSLADRALAGIGWTWLLDTAPLRKTLVRILGGERVRAREDVTVSVSAVEKPTGSLARFTNRLPPPPRRTAAYRQVDLNVDHLMASSAIPLAFRPAEADGTRWWDGGLVANTPLAPAMAHEPDAVIVVTTSTQERPAPQPESLGDAIGLLIDSLLAHSLTNDIRHARMVNELCRLDPDRPGAKEVDLVVIEPTGLELGGPLDFSPRLVEHRLQLGLQLGREQLGAWRR